MNRNQEISNGYRGKNRVAESQLRKSVRIKSATQSAGTAIRSSMPGLRKIVSRYPIAVLFGAVILGGVAGWYVKRR